MSPHGRPKGEYRSAQRGGTPAIAPAGGVGMLLKRYPKISETFILEEILGLEAMGMPLTLFSLLPPSDAIVHAAIGRVRASVHYVDGGEGIGLAARIGIHLRVFLSRPGAYLRGLASVLMRIESGRFAEWDAAVRLVPLLEAAGIRHLHVHFASSPAGVAEIASRLAGITFSLSAHAKDIYLSDRDVLRRKLAAAEFTVTCTDYNRRYLAAAVGPEGRVVCMHHGIDAQRFRYAESPRRHANGPGGLPLILSVGRLREKKGFDVLVDACQRLVRLGVAFRCEIVGYGEEHDRLQARIGRLGLTGRVRLVGKLSQAEVIARYREAALFVLPCRIGEDGDRDGIPNVLLEAMAMELPVVSTEVSGIPEVVRSGVNGRLVDPGDPVVLAGAMIDLIEDVELRTRFGAAGRAAVVAGFSNAANLRIVHRLIGCALRGETIDIAALQAPEGYCAQ